MPHRKSLFLGLLACLVSTIAISAEITKEDADKAIRVVPDNLFEIEFVGNRRGWITGYHGTILRTDDAGKSWSYLSLESDELLRRGSFPTENTAWLVGHRGSIYHTEDAGENWGVSHKEEGIYLRDIAFLNERLGWAVGHEGVILFTNDSGQIWQKQAISDWTKRDLPRLSAITILDENRVVVTGEFGVFAYTSDAGMTWKHVLLEGQPSMTSMASHGEKILAVGLDGVVASAAFTEEGDFVVQKLPLNIPTHLLDIRITQQGVLASGYGVVVHCDAELQCKVLDTTEDFPSNFLWLAGVDLAPDGSVWSVGLGGYVGKAPSLSEPISTEFVLGGPHWATKQAKGEE